MVCLRCDLRRHGLKLMARGGPAARKKAITAVARKLAVLLHHLWVTGEVYEPNHNQKLDNKPPAPIASVQSVAIQPAA